MLEDIEAKFFIHFSVRKSCEKLPTNTTENLKQASGEIKAQVPVHPKINRQGNHICHDEQRK